MTLSDGAELLRTSRERVEEGLHGAVERLTEHLGGAARRRVVILLACVLALDSADKGAIGALSAQLESALHIGNTKVGLLVTASTLVGAAMTLPFGALTDRTRRTRLLWITILLWAVAQAACALADSYVFLLLTRLALGAVTAAAGPAVASLTGDLFATGERARIYGFILTGELVGAGLGLLVAGEVAGFLSWRASFLALAVPSLALSWAIRRYLPEPARGGQSRLAPGAEEIPSVEEVEAHPEDFEAEADAAADAAAADRPRRRGAKRPAGPAPTGSRRDATVQRQAEAAGYRARPERVLAADPDTMGLRRAVRYVLSIPTNIALIAASSLGYFFFAGVETFAIILLRGRYGMSQSGATSLLLVIGIGAVAGVLSGGRAADRLVMRGRVDGRLLVGAVSYVAAALVFVPALLVPVLALGLPLYVVGAAAVAAPNAPLNAARLDVVQSRLWGRAEGVRTVVQTLLQAAAPLLFGFVSQLLGGAAGGLGAGINSAHAGVSPAAGRGVEYAFLIMLVPLAASGLILFRSRRMYPADVLAAVESERRYGEAESSPEVAASPAGPPAS
ncbi:MAG TPA: MFS transporter [Acidimicrobiales bacterium]|nr:MFS transporter [Acidimicrobiales bacterium]